MRLVVITITATLLVGCGGGGSGASSTPGITRSLTSSTLALTEGGAAQTFSYVLNSAPSANVIITLTTGSYLVVVPTTVTFTSANWNVSQTITVAAVDDNIANGLHTDAIKQTISSNDGRYSALILGDITANITDNDTPGVTISESNGGTQVTEGGADDSYTLMLKSRPGSDVVITVSNDGQLVATPSTLTFNQSNWNLPQTVTVTAVDNTTVEGAHSSVLRHTSTSNDPNYNGVTINSITVQIIDNDTIATLEFIGEDAIAREGDGRISIPVRLRLNAPVTVANPVAATITILASSTVRNNVDITPLTSGISFPTNTADGAIQNFTIDIADDALPEPIEAIDLRLTDANGLGSVLGNQVNYSIHLYDHELPQLIASSVTSFTGYSESTLLGIDPSTAAARRFSGAGLAGFAPVSGLAYDAGTGTLYGVANGELVKFNVYTGVGNAVGPTAVTRGLAYDPGTGSLYGSDGAHLYSVNTATAVTSVIGTFGAYSDVEGLAYNGNVLYGSDTTANVLLLINKSTGSANAVGGFGATGLASLTYAANTLYAASTTQHRLYTVNSATGAATAVGTQPLGFNNVTALSATANAATLYGFDTGTRQLITVDRASGVGQSYKMTGFGDNFGVQLTGTAYDATRQIYYGVAANPAGEQYLLHVRAATGTAISVAKITGVSGSLFDLAYDNNSGTLYGVNGASLYRIDVASAAASVIGNMGGNSQGLAFDTNHNILYASDTNTDQLLKLDPSNGTKIVIGNLGFGNVAGLAYDIHTDTLYGIDTDPIGKNPRLITISTVGGAGTTIGAILHEDMSGALAYDSTHNKLYGANKLGLLRLDTTNGRGTSVGQLGIESVTDVAYNPNTGVLYAVASDSDDGKLLTLDLAAGTATPIGGLGIACCVDGLTFIPTSNALYGVDTASGNLVRINVDTGAATIVGSIGFNRIAGALAYDPTGNTLYGIGGTDTSGSGAGPYTYRLITINPNTGLGTAVAMVNYAGISALAVDPTTRTLYGYDTTTAQLLTFNTGTGAGTVIGKPGYDVRGLTWRY